MAAKQAPVREVLKRMKKAYPGADCTLEFGNRLQLLVATILSAQCTDERVNRVTPGLFRKYRTAKDFAEADPNELEQDIRSTGFYKNKARSLRNACRNIVDEHGGKVPADMDSLVALPGIGRKTANVVDTHVGRVARRLGWTREKNAEKVERALNDLIPRKDWVRVGHELILHGRNVCTSRKPKCPECPVSDLCPSAGRA